MTGPLRGRAIGILGFGNQGEAQALNLRDSGVDVRVGARPRGPGEARARSLGFPTFAPEQALREVEIAAVLLPDERVPEIWPSLRGAMRPDLSLVFAHGFNLLYSDLELPERGDVVVVSPAAPGRILREAYSSGEGPAAYLAVHREGAGRAWELAESWASALGCGRTWRTTVREETEVDLFGEQAVLCGGMNALVTAAFETLVERGYRPEMAYLECVHQLKHLADLLHQKGVAGMREGISGTALFGDLTRGPRVVGEDSRREMERLIEEIRNGEFAQAWRAEVAAGTPVVQELLRRGRRHPIEEARERALGASPPLPSVSSDSPAAPSPRSGPSDNPPESRKTLSKT